MSLRSPPTFIPTTPRSQPASDSTGEHRGRRMHRKTLRDAPLMTWPRPRLKTRGEPLVFESKTCSNRSPSAATSTGQEQHDTQHTLPLSSLPM